MLGLGLLAGQQVKVTRLAHSVPEGGELDYLDEAPCPQRCASERLSKTALFAPWPECYLRM